MKRAEFNKIVKLAATKGFSPNFQSLGVFNGCALDSRRRYVTRDQVASLLVWQAYTFNGTWDETALQECAEYSKRFDLID